MHDYYQTLIALQIALDQDEMQPWRPVQMVAPVSHEAVAKTYWIITGLMR